METVIYNPKTKEWNYEDYEERDLPGPTDERNFLRIVAGMVGYSTVDKFYDTKYFESLTIRKGPILGRGLEGFVVSSSSASRPEESYTFVPVGGKAQPKDDDETDTLVGVKGNGDPAPQPTSDVSVPPILSEMRTPLQSETYMAVSFKKKRGATRKIKYGPGTSAPVDIVQVAKESARKDISSSEIESIVLPTSSQDTVYDPLLQTNRHSDKSYTPSYRSSVTDVDMILKNAQRRADVMMEEYYDTEKSVDADTEDIRKFREEIKSRLGKESEGKKGEEKEEIGRMVTYISAVNDLARGNVRLAISQIFEHIPESFDSSFITYRNLVSHSSPEVKTWFAKLVAANVERSLTVTEGRTHNAYKPNRANADIAGVSARFGNLYYDGGSKKLIFKRIAYQPKDVDWIDRGLELAEPREQDHRSIIDIYSPKRKKKAVPGYGSSAPTTVSNQISLFSSHHHFFSDRKL